MTDLIGVPRRSPASGAGGSPDTLTKLAITAFVIVTLWGGRSVFVPIAIAVLLSFVLAPMVRILRRWRVGRGLSVLIVVAIAFSIIFALGAVLTRQITQLAIGLPQYEKTISTKVASIRGAATNWSFLQGASRLVQNFGAEVPHPAPAEPLQSRTTLPPQTTQESPPVRVVVQEPSPRPFDILESVALSAFEPLATTGIMLVFVIFILLQREDLRDRIIRLAGSGDLQRTTAAIDDAAQRLSRYFLAQTAVNACFGLIVGFGLWMIGVPSAPLWGILAMILRFVPYIGSFVSAAFPIALSAAVAPGWTMTLETAALFLIAEPLVGQAVEPLLYGHSTGLSPIAVVVAATIWTWLWGPVGLVLSTPLTVCLVVLGRHVDQLEFLDILLGDAPPLNPAETFYQRALAGHPMEAVEQAERMLKSASLSDYYNDVALPALLLAQSDVRRGTLDVERQRRLCETIEELADALADRPDREPDRPSVEDEPPASLRAPEAPKLETRERIADDQPHEIKDSWKTSRAVLCVSGRGALDRAAGVMLAQLLCAHGLTADVEEGEMLAPRRIGDLDLAGVQLVCLSYFDARVNSAHVRFAMRRLRRRSPNVILLAGLWAAPDETPEIQALSQESGADAYATDLKQAVEICLEASRPGPTRDETRRNAAVAAA
jgi:predicted PurR-regulated permease PerM